MANTSTIVLTNAPDRRDDSASGALLSDSDGRLRAILEDFGVVVSITES